MKYQITESKFQTRITEIFLWLPLELPFNDSPNASLYGPRQKRWLESARIQQFRYNKMWHNSHWADGK